MAESFFAADILTTMDDTQTAPTTPTHSTQSTSQPASHSSFDLGYGEIDFSMLAPDASLAGEPSQWSADWAYPLMSDETGKTIETAFLQPPMGAAASRPAMPMAPTFEFSANPSSLMPGVGYGAGFVGTVPSIPPHMAQQTPQWQQQLHVASHTALPASTRTSPIPHAYPYDRRASSSGGSSESLRREESVMSDAARPRPKSKLSIEDKKRICQIHREEGGRLRQEDIAKMFSVDRSTISKIIGQSARFLSDEPRIETPPAKQGKKEGKFPQVDFAIDQWMDGEMAAGRDIRESEARSFAIRLAEGLGHDRFKASSKWFKNLRARREANGKSTAVASSSASLALSRSASNMSFASDISAATTFPPESPSVDTSAMGRLALSGGTDFGPAFFGSPMHGQYNTAPASSSRHTLDTGSPLARSPYVYDQSGASMASSMSSASSRPPSFAGDNQVSPSSGKAPKSTPLFRQKSYNGSSTTPTRPTPLSRANSTQGRPSPHHRLGAAALGLTPTLSPLSQSVTREADHQQPPPPQPQFAQMQPPHAGGARSTPSMPSNPFYAFSPSMSEMGEAMAMAPPGLVSATPVPITPITPAHGYGPGVFPNIDYGSLAHDMGHDFGPAFTPGAPIDGASFNHAASTATTPTQYVHVNHKTPPSYVPHDVYGRPYAAQAYEQSAQWQ